jgi:ABC-2 type transport system permease protein
MIAAIRAEWLKFATTRAWWVTSALMFGYMAMLAAMVAGALVLGSRAEGAESVGTAGLPTIESGAIASATYTLAVALGYIFPAVLGALAVRSEFRHRTITPTLLVEPRRTTLLTAKAVVVVPFGLAVSVAGTIGTVTGGAAVLALLGEPTRLGDQEIQRAVALSVVALVLWSLVGVGFGAVLTNQVAAIVVLIVFTQFVEPILRLALAQFEVTEGVSRFLPGAAGEAIAGSSLYSSSGVADLLTAWQGALVLGAVAALLLVTGRVTSFRRDIG